MRSENSGVSDATNRSWFPCQEKHGGFRPPFPLYRTETHLCGCQEKKARLRCSIKSNNTTEASMKHMNTAIQTPIEQPQTELLIKHARTSIFTLTFVALA